MTECERNGHDFEHASGERRCRRCALRETEHEMDEYYSGHEWEPDGAVYNRCRRCGARVLRDASGGSGW